MKTSYAALRALVIITHIVSPLAATSVSFAAASSAHGLPAPEVSRALDAVLMPIDKAVAKEFNLAKGTRGVLVLAVKPGGVADRQGIEPGDVLSDIRGHKIHKPVDVDVAVSRSLKAGHSDIAFALVRNGAPFAVAALITLGDYNEAVSMTEISTWQSYTSESFAYSEYISEVSQSIETSYESEEATVEEAMAVEESSSEEESVDATVDAADSGDADEADGDEAGADLDGDSDGGDAGDDGDSGSDDSDN